MASDALPPLRLRSCPQPQRISAGEVAAAYASAAARRRVSVDARFGRRALERPRLRALAQPIGAAGVRVEERGVGVPFLEQVAVDRERHRQIGAGPDGEMNVGLSWRAASCADR